MQHASRGDPFFAMEWLQGIDSRIGRAFIRDDNGVLVRLAYDSDVTGGGRCAPRVWSSVCKSALRVGKQGQLDCEIEGPGRVVCEAPRRP